MTVTIFNASLFVGWLMATIGLMLVNVGAGFAVGGIILIAITLYVARLGGVFTPKQNEEI